MLVDVGSFSGGRGLPIDMWWWWRWSGGGGWGLGGIGVWVEVGYLAGSGVFGWKWGQGKWVRVG